MKRRILLIVILLAISIVSVLLFVNRDRNTTMSADPLSGSPIPTNSVDIPSPTQSPDPVPAEWKSYSSAEYGFMIRYPADIEQSSTSEGERFFKAGPTQALGTELFDGISLVISSGNLGAEDFKSYVEGQYTLIKNGADQPRLGELQEVTIRGKTGYSFTVSSLGDRTNMYLPKGDTEYLLIVDGTVEPQNSGRNYQETVATMLSSLVYE